jgi:flagellar motor protein MotB
MQGQIRIDTVGDSHSTNFALSTRRASSAYNVMIGLQQDEDLDDYQSNQPPLSERLLFNLIAPVALSEGGASALPKRLIAVSGYGQFSPLAHCEKKQGATGQDENEQETCNKQNRRIELRFVMATPEPDDNPDALPETID